MASLTTGYKKEINSDLIKKYKRQRIINRFLKRGNRILMYVVMIGFTFITMIPLIWMILCSFKTNGENLSYPPTILPQKLTLEHYQLLFKQTSFLIWFKNSFVVTVATTFIAIVISAMGSYAFSRFRNKFFDLFSRLVLFAYMIPTVLMIIPVFIIIHSLDQSNKLSGLVIVYNALLIPYGLWTLRSYFAGIPHEIEEAALLDGCTRWQALTIIVLPQVIPGIISTALFSFTVCWNEYLYATVLLWSSANQTLSAGVATFMGGDAPASWGLLMAAGVMVTMPVIMLFSFLQKYWVAGLGAGAVKG
ncbi:carbohydrate ABC transporter permease [Patescibacteria group bacterium]|nr:carbohydrate ABC transporter permease [Patescibacteria group bacterium]MBU1934483.1 carbohydrate ABC transporter permease [Patescibacteria group bacterium]